MIVSLLYQASTLCTTVVVDVVGYCLEWWSVHQHSSVATGNWYQALSIVCGQHCVCGCPGMHYTDHNEMSERRMGINYW
jgi:hypothetical protein